MATNNNFKAESKNKSTKISFIIFVVVLIATIGLYVYNGMMTSKIESLRIDINNVDLQTQQLKQDKKIELYTLISDNSTVLEKYKRLSDIPKYVNNLVVLSRDYRAKIRGFQYDAGTLASKVIMSNDELAPAFVKTKNFLEYFRKKDENIFGLDFVKSFQGQTEISFQTQFKLK